ncbi:hypothetical protein ACFV2U_53165 [Streptomyces sp. NPDC059697]|uniref:hypothetical protein n=1 Tax=Streptomyces sp. NPDC059697 TaxID=3346912 RepID=UPI00368BA688
MTSTAVLGFQRPWTDRARALHERHALRPDGAERETQPAMGDSIAPPMPLGDRCRPPSAIRDDMGANWNHGA